MKNKTLNDGFNDLLKAMEGYTTDDIHNVFSALVGMMDIDLDEEPKGEILRKVEEILNQFSDDDATGLIRIAMAFYRDKQEWELEEGRKRRGLN